MRLPDLLDEYDISLDDIRWHLSLMQAKRLLTYDERPEELARLIWSGSLESELHDMEEELLASLQGDLDTGRTDEEQVRVTLEEIRASKISRRRDS